MNDYAFGNFICTLREKKELTQAELARQLGVTPAAVSKWENGSSKPRVEILFQLAEILGVKTEELMAGHYIVQETLDPEAVRQINERYEYLRKIDSHTAPKVKARRFIAWLLDWNIIGFSVSIALVIHMAAFAPKSGEDATPLFAFGTLALMLLFPVLFVLRDVLMKGRSPGKRITGLVVIDKSTGELAKASKQLVKNLFLFAVHIDAIFLLVSGKSIGDRVANTVVILKKDFENTDSPPSVSNTQKINSYVAPKPLTTKRIVLTVCVIALVIALFVTFVFGLVTTLLNQQKNTEEYHLAYHYLLENLPPDQLNVSEDDIKLTSYNSHIYYNEYGHKVKSIEFGFSVNGKNIPITCYFENNEWHVYSIYPELK